MASGLQTRIQELISECLENFKLKSEESQGMPAFTPATHLSRLDEELAYLRNVHKAVSAEISARVARLSTHRNSLLPVDRLPPELLCYVIEASLDHFDAAPETGTTRRLLALASVSRRWKAVLDQSPSVWGWIDTLKDVPFAVQKSQRALLSVNLVNEGEFDTPKLEQGFVTLLPHSERWQSLQLHLTAIAARKFTEIFGSLSIPSLQDLGLVVNARRVENDHPALDSLDRYPLRRLVLSGISTSWDTLASFTELRSLRVANLCYGNTWLSRYELTNILLGCAHLEELALSKLGNYPADTSIPPPSQSNFYLPALKSIELKNILNSGDTGLWLLDSISAPHLRGLSVSGDRLNKLIGHPIASVLSRQRTDSPFPVVMDSLKSRPVHIHITQQWCRFDCEHVLKRGAHQGLELHLPGRGFADTYQRLTDTVPGIIGASLHPQLRVHLEKLPQSYLPNLDPDPAILSHLPFLSVLRIERVPNVEAFLQFLCSRGPGDPAEYYCPNLTEVHFLRAGAARITITETQRGAVKQLMEKRPNVALYDNEGLYLSRHFKDDGNQEL